MHANGAAQYFEEALKIRNLLQEFEAPEEGGGGGAANGTAKRDPRPIAIVGFPEHM